MVTCRECGNNKWRIFETTKESSNAVRLECIECGNVEDALYKNRKILVSSKGVISHYGHSFVSSKCPSCGRNEWKIFQYEIVCMCKERINLDAKTIRASKKTRLAKKEKDYYGKKPK